MANPWDKDELVSADQPWANDAPVGGGTATLEDPGEKPVSFSLQGLKDFGRTMAQPFQEMYGGAKTALAGEKAKGANQILTGAGRIAKPMAMGASLPFAWEAPAAAAVGMGASAIGSAGGGALARLGARVMGASPDTEELAGTAGEGIGGIAGGVGGALGERALGRSAASGLRNIALGTTRKVRAFDTNPGEASLKETKGILPENIAASAKQRMGELNSVYEKTVAHGSDVPLTPARSAASRSAGEAARLGSPTLASQVAPMELQLQGNQVTGAPYPETVPARQALDILRGFNQEQGAPNPLRMGKASGYAKSIGGTLRDSIREAAPGSEELATRMHNLGPVEQLAARQEMAPGMVETGVSRLTRPTGGLMPLLAGLAHGGLPGGGAVLAGQEALSQPVVTSALGRMLWRLHGGERLGVPEMPQLRLPPATDTSGAYRSAGDFGSIGSEYEPQVRLLEAPKGPIGVSGVTAPDYAGQIKRGATNLDIGPRQIEAPGNPMGSSARGPVVPDIIGASSRGKGGGQYLLPAPEHGTPPVNVLPRGPAGAGHAAGPSGPVPALSTETPRPAPGVRGGRLMDILQSFRDRQFPEDPQPLVKK